MNLNEIGEFGFIERISKNFTNLIPKGTKGIGDDCAVYPINEKESFLVTTDLLIENIHFLKNKITPEELGHKSLAVNLSDIAAMGGTPIMTFLSIAFPKSLNIDWLDKFFEGYNNLSQKESVALMGGDTTKSPDGIVINVAVIGKIENDKIKYRNGAKVGDIICKTGFTGESGVGLKFILENFSPDDAVKYFISKHNLPDAKISEGKFLSNYSGVHAMMDISDGIDSDLKHILIASGVSAEINLDNFPLSKKISKAAKVYNFNPLEKALAAGEDYELLLTVDGNKFENISDDFNKKFSSSLLKIGKIIEGKENLVYLMDGKKHNLSEKGFNHFR